MYLIHPILHEIHPICARKFEAGTDKLGNVEAWAVEVGIVAKEAKDNN